MKTVVLDQDVVEVEVKPHELLDTYRDLLRQDVEEMLVEDLERSVCPGCLSFDSSRAFVRFGMVYRRCDMCGSLFVSPRPSEQKLIEFYRTANAMKFWREEILPATRENRRSKLFRPRAQWLLDVVDEYRPEAKRAMAVGFHNDLLIEELLGQEDQLFEITVTNLVADIEFANKKLPGVHIQPTPVNELSKVGSVDLLLAFDILDRSADLETLFAAASEVLEPGGLLLATTNLGSGFDIQVLWDRSEGIYPPERLNLLTVEGLTALYERHGFEALEFSTPGMFDVEEVHRAVLERPQDDWPIFIKYLVENREEGALEALQEFLQRFRLSSFARLVLQKKVD